MPLTAPLLQTRIAGLPLHRTRQGARRLRRWPTACSSSPPIASRPSTTCSGRASPTRAGSSRSCRRSGSTSCGTSCRTTCVSLDARRLPARRRAPSADVLAGRTHARAAHDAGADRVRGARVSRRARAGRSTGRTGRVCGIALPAGLREADRLPEPIFTPATKADVGPRREHPGVAGRRAGRARRGGSACADLTLALYRACRRARRVARHHPRRHEVRVRLDRRPGASDLILIDEALTPDSSRFWPADG